MSLLTDIFTYAYRGSGKYIMTACVALSIIAKLAGIAPLVGPIAGLLLSGYFCAIYHQMIQSSATGDRDAPEFPEVSNLFEDIIWPMLRIFVILLFSFGPMIGYSLRAGDERANAMIFHGLLALGASYFPMAMLAVVVLGYMGAASPHIVVPAIFRGGWLYWGGVLMLCGLYAMGSMIEEALSGWWIAGPLVMSVVSVYTMMTHARILGVVYRERREHLGWL